MPEFKAAAPKPKALACVIHGNDPSCPGPYQCAGYVLPSAPPRVKHKVEPTAAELKPAAPQPMRALTSSSR